MTERWSLAAGHTPEPWLIALLAACAALLLYEAFDALRRPRIPHPVRLRLAILGLRLLALAALVGLAFELTLRVESMIPSGRRLVVLFDDSASMALPDATTSDTAPVVRGRRALEAWEEAKATRARWSEDGLLLDVRAFDDELRSVGVDDLGDQLTFDGSASDLARGLTELSSGASTDQAPIAGIVVVSDGLVAPDPAADRHLTAVAEGLQIPITTVAVGAPIVRDVSVAHIQAEMFAFVENVTEFEAALVAHGYENSPAEVELRRNGEVVARRRILLRGDGIETPVRFEVAPDRIGQFIYEIAVLPQDGEATEANNTHAFVVKVLRDKVRVLHVAGRPDWDVRSLRTLLRRDPNVELLSYYILRGTDDIARDDAEQEELSLIPFPTDELFEQELGSFDLVLLHNFDAVRHQVGRYLRNIAQYVLEGGALVLIGGDLGLAEGGYASPEIAQLLPIAASQPAPLREQSFRPQLTDAGRRHPITAWLTSSAGWGELPELDHYNEAEMTRSAVGIGAAPLLVHPDRRDSSGNPRPILSVSEPSQGRVMVLTTGASWRLGFAPDLPLVDGARPYDLLWLGAVRWLLRDETSGRLSLETDQPRYQFGEPVELRATTLTASYAPEPEVQVQWEVHPLVAGNDSGQAVVQGTWTTDALGRANRTIEDLAIGAYEAVARRSGGADESASVHEVRRVFLVEHPTRELALVAAPPGTEQLRKLAQMTGGDHRVLADGQDLPGRIPVRDPFASDAPAGNQVTARNDRPLWSGWSAMVLLVFAFGGEWILRRRQGER